MNTKNPLAVWAKRAIPALALAATSGVMLPSCEKEPIEKKPYEKELFFNQKNQDSISTVVLTKFARDGACTHIYMHVADDNNFGGYESYIVRNFLQERIKISSKISGRGDFAFRVGIDKSDSLWFVQNGWTVNKRYWDAMNQR